MKHHWVMWLILLFSSFLFIYFIFLGKCSEKPEQILKFYMGLIEYLIELQAQKQCLLILVTSHTLQYRWFSFQWPLTSLFSLFIIWKRSFSQTNELTIPLRPLLASLQIAFTFLVYPALILAYMGQAAYLSQHHYATNNIGFYDSVPGINHW